MDKDPQTFAIIGAAMKVYNTLGFGFLEPVYQSALAREFEYQNIPFAKEVSIPVYYREEKLDTSYRADFICYDNIIVELKALKQITKKEESQVINYLKATKFKKSLILNFGGRSLEYKRLIYTL